MSRGGLQPWFPLILMTATGWEGDTSQERQRNGLSLVGQHEAHLPGLPVASRKRHDFQLSFAGGLAGVWDDGAPGPALQDLSSSGSPFSPS